MSHGDHVTRNRGPIRFLLLALGVPQALIGAWALMAPRSFYDGFPAGTGGWVNPLGPFDEHLTTDVGALFVALGLVLAFAAFSLRRGTVLAAAIGWLAFATPHFVWHVFNLGPYGTGDTIASTLATGWTVAGGVLVLALLRAPSASARAAPGAAGARIAGVSDRRAGPLARAAYSYSRKTLGEVTEPTRVYAHHPTLLAGYGALEYATARADRVPRELKALVTAKAAALTGCEFCIDISSSLAAQAGVSEAKLRALPEHATSPELDELERLALDLAVGMSRTPVEVSGELFDALHERLDEAQLVELANEIALESYRARFNWAFGIGSQGFAAGAYCIRAEPVPT